MKIVAIGLSHNEADVVRECVKDALSWVDAFILYDNSTDGTDTLAREAGAMVLRGPVDEIFDEGLRQYALTAAAALDPDWIVRIDPDEFYPRGISVTGYRPQDPRAILENYDKTGVMATRAQVVQFWITFDDLRRGLLLEDETVSVQKRRRWYSFGHTAIVAWKHNLVLAYKYGSMKNIPFYPDGQDVGKDARGALLIQTHYTCRSLPQLVARVADRKKNGGSFGKYKHNLIIDETVVGLGYWNDGEPIIPYQNHDFVYKWFEISTRLYAERAAGWNL